MSVHAHHGLHDTLPSIYAPVGVMGSRSQQVDRYGLLSRVGATVNAMSSNEWVAWSTHLGKLYT